MVFQRSPRAAERNARRSTRNPRYAPEALEGRLNPSGFVPSYCGYAPIEYSLAPAAVSPAPAPLPPAPDPILPPSTDPIPPCDPALMA